MGTFTDHKWQLFPSPRCKMKALAILHGVTMGILVFLLGEINVLLDGKIEPNEADVFYRSVPSLREHSLRMADGFLTESAGSLQQRARIHALPFDRGAALELYRSSTFHRCHK
ncbi:hypothetical protein AVEN_10776-1 [Araneus ventricosus]|uniref:Uncharacterized protein n=1 Tax=Araneus ventricosus TaxID=182803 RepID=A0A4Y2N9Y0_ARAVE|nr:hypothetical protein AVEN_10776-1 [Araneus ventricosus]